MADSYFSTEWICIYLETPCEKFTFSSTGGVQNDQPGLLGVYELTNILNYDRVVYKHQESELYMYSLFEDENSAYNGVWMVRVRKICSLRINFSGRNFTLTNIAIIFLKRNHLHNRSVRHLVILLLRFITLIAKMWNSLPMDFVPMDGIIMMERNGYMIQLLLSIV